MKKIYKHLAVLILLVSLASCKKEVKQEGTPVQDMAGEWWVQVFLGEDFDTDDGYYKVMTFNTSDFQSDKIWVDFNSYWPFKGKASVNYGNLEFANSEPIYDSSYDEAYGIGMDTITITGGKIIQGASVPPSGTTTDSIYIEFYSRLWANYYGDETYAGPYYLKGYRRTGFTEDEH